LNPNGMDALRAIGAHQPVIAVSFPLVRSEFYAQSGCRARLISVLPAGISRAVARLNTGLRLHNSMIVKDYPTPNNKLTGGWIKGCSGGPGQVLHLRGPVGLNLYDRHGFVDRVAVGVRRKGDLAAGTRDRF
jgi:hypothetical protein